ncbi:hypothetical protein PS1_017159 [Malus domestica]
MWNRANRWSRRSSFLLHRSAAYSRLLSVGAPQSLQMQWFGIRVQRCWDQIELQSFRENGRSTLVFSRQPSSSPATQLQLSSNLCHTLHKPVAATTASSPEPQSTASLQLQSVKPGS